MKADPDEDCPNAPVDDCENVEPGFVFAKAEGAAAFVVGAA